MRSGTTPSRSAPRAYITGTMAAKPVANGTEYTLIVDNGGLPGKGLSAEDVTIAVALVRASP